MRPEGRDEATFRMNVDERPRCVFEDVGSYDKPPLPPLPPFDDYESLARQGFIRKTESARRVFKFLVRAIGYPAFHERLPDKLETVLRTTNMREGRLFAPAFTATAALADDPRELTAIERAATLIVAARGLCDDIMHGRLSPESHRDGPAEMGQYPNLFSTTALVDGAPRLYKSKNFDHVAVLVRRRMYVLRVGSPGEKSARQLATELADIVARAHAERPVPDEEAVGILSAAKMRTLRSALRAMSRSQPNAGSLSKVRDCFLTLCLDLDDSPPTASDAAYRAQAANPANRWYCSSLQIVVFGNAKAATLYSFLAYLDGNVMTRSAAELCTRGRNEPLSPPDAAASREAAAPLSWQVDARLARRAWRAVRAVQDPQQATFEIRDLGRDALRARGLDPVGAFVVALALATRRCSGKVPRILQLVTISKFRCVPIGAAMVTTPELERFLAHIENGEDARAPQLLKEAIAAQSRECRAERSRLSLRWPLEAFIREQRGLRKVRCMAALGLSMAALAATGSLGSKDVVISHPQIVPEVPVIGRPGVRLPYVNHYAVHYRLYPERTVLTFMPGLKWKTSNAEFTGAIADALRDVMRVGV